MDFQLDEAAEDLRLLTAEILDKTGASGEVGANPDPGEVWAKFAEAGLIEAFLPEELGGTAADAVSLAAVLREVGLRAAPVPALPVLAMGVLPLVRHAGPDLASVLERVAGGAILTAAVREPGGARATQPATTAAAVAGGYVLQGTKTMVPFGAEAEWILVPARLGDGGVGVFLVSSDVEGLEVAPQPTGSHIPAAAIALNSVRVAHSALVGGDTESAVARTLELSTWAGIAAQASGHLEAALKLTAEHVKTRRQFGRALAEFQAVAMTVSDVYIANLLLTNLTWGGAWRFEAGDPDEAAETLASALLVITEEVAKALLACQQVHGSLGFDATYPLHRHFSAGLHFSRWIGGPDGALELLGDLVDTRTGEAQCASL
ncbi:acyl-CoA/acyl-ACP dehydrogenase [Arthrobacter sp. I2-34]|uniref:Acyl-CoA/acyl-ACP dehydrogenase n=1 Tax=Arthrobacter hankyongi TaxID=2904801 RepID=A0ABS9L3R1_9MICC|nr:acyl-CoA dehydrogenase family protein [Arthrobacter hankyongi]MCG2621315.1 acyl-CoA/acyl-ACP dehydrogenase [Arthrobacter hankyongi]